jgi:hypothetical protein
MPPSNSIASHPPDLMTRHSARFCLKQPMLPREQAQAIGANFVVRPQGEKKGVTLP